MTEIRSLHNVLKTLVDYGCLLWSSKYFLQKKNNGLTFITILLYKVHDKVSNTEIELFLNESLMEVLFLLGKG